MRHSDEQRYGDIAILFHWLIALCIIGLLIVGKYMSGLDEDDHTRFLLTQWHKSFGITVLILSVLRILWRVTHRPPPEPDYLPKWQKLVAGGTHLLLYALMLILPLTGWIMVSASPLNLDTILFNVIPWPHLPGLEDLPNRADIARDFHGYHELASTVLIVLLLAHIGAAIKHHFIDKDTILVRMLPRRGSESFPGKVFALLLVLLSSGVLLNYFSGSGDQTALLAAGDSEVSFIADVTGEPTAGVFTDTTVEAVLDEKNPGNSTIMARVNTRTVNSENLQVAGSLPESEWFDVENFPEALFESTSIEADENGALRVTGNLTLKSTAQEVSFPMSLTTEGDKRVARGEFTIDRREYDIGMESNANEDFVGFEVLIKFRFDIAETDGLPRSE